MGWYIFHEMTDNTLEMLFVQIGLGSLIIHGCFLFFSPAKIVMAMGMNIGSKRISTNMVSVELFSLQSNAFWRENIVQPLALAYLEPRSS